MVGMEFNTPDEQEAVEAVFSSALQVNFLSLKQFRALNIYNKMTPCWTCKPQCLSPEDRALPPVQYMLPMLKRGIGVHHSGVSCLQPSSLKSEFV